jgi:hypothetical protein
MVAISDSSEVTSDVQLDELYRVSVLHCFTELVSRGIQWKRGLEGFDKTESEVVNDWINQGELTQCRKDILQLLEGRFLVWRHVM